MGKLNKWIIGAALALICACCALAALNVTVTPNSNSIGRYDIYELALATSDAFPSNYNFQDDPDISATFTAPSAKTYTVGAFYCNTKPVNTWKIRFAPTETGNWTYTLKFDNKSGGIYNTNGSLSCIASSNRGFIRQYAANPYRFYTEGDNKPFYPVGFGDGFGQNPKYVIDKWNMDGAGGNATIDQYFGIYASQGKNNMFRMNTGGNSPQMYLSRNDYSAGKNTYDLAAGFMLDTVMMKLHQYKYKPYLVFWQDGIGNGTITGTGVRQATFNFHRYMVARYAAYVDVWELMNEKTPVDLNYLPTVANYVRSIDPYKHIISQSDPQPAMTGIDNVSRHWYYTVYNASTGVDNAWAFTYLADDMKNWKTKQPGHPLIYGEGNLAGPCNVNADGYRVGLWITFVNEGSLLFWNSSWSTTYCTGQINQYMGPTERASSRIFDSLICDFDPLAKPIPVTISPANAIAYGLGSGKDIGVYTLSGDFTKSLATAKIMLTIPAAGMRGYWIDPSTGQVVQAITPASGAQTISVPAYTKDLFLRITQSTVTALQPGIANAAARPAPVIAVESGVVQFSVFKAGATTLRMYDVSGRLVKTLLKGERGVGMHKVLLNNTGSGVYLFTLENGSRKISLVAPVIK